MAIPFFKGQTGGLSPTGYSGPISSAGQSMNVFIDASIISQLQAAGYILTPVNIAADYAYTNFQIINKVVIGGKSIPALQDGSGNVYIIDEKKTVYLLEKSKVNPTTGIPNDSAVPGNTGGPVIGPPLIFNPPPPYIPPVLPYSPDPINPPIMPPGGVIGSGKIYTAFTSDDVIANQQEIVTRAMWSNNTGNLLTFFTSSEQTTSQKRYYYQIHNSSSQSSCSGDAQFAIAYGHKLGSGSTDEGGQIEDTPSRAIYGQYRLLCLDSNQQHFTINGSTTEHIYAINVNRARMREYIDEGNVEINIAYLSGSQFLAGGGLANAHTGSNVRIDGSGRVLRLIDDSTLNAATITQAGEVYNMVSGTIEDGIYNESNPQVFGQLYRRLGIIILDANKLNITGSFATVTGSDVNGDNSYKLFTAISGAAKYQDASGDYLGFAARSAERVKSTYYFCRAKNAEFNFSNNPSFVTGSEGDLTHPSMINDPRTYITTVGLYNNRKELIAVAKLSQAAQKAFTREALFKVKLDFVWIIGFFGMLGSCFV